MAGKRKRRTARKKTGYRLATYPSAVRMALLVDEMPRHSLGRRLASVADSLGVSSQTIRRYVKAMAEDFTTEEGLPQFVIEKKAEELWLVRRSRYEDSAASTIYQLVSLYLSLEFFRMLGSNNLFVKLVDEVMGEVAKKLSSPKRGLVHDLPRKFFAAPWAPKDYSAHGDQLNDVIKAVVYQNAIKLTYRPYGAEPKLYTAHPLTLLYHKGSLYLVARPVERKRPVYFAVERILVVEVTPEKFAYPGDYHPDRMLDGAFGIFGGPATTFRLRFPAELAEYIAGRRWHKSQRLHPQRDGSLILTLKVTDSEEVRSWIRSFGKKVAVLAE